MDKDKFFPLHDRAGAKTSLNHEMMHHMSEATSPITVDEFENKLQNHQEFLQNGGKEGNWQSFEVSGLTLAVYSKSNILHGKQLSLLNSNLSLLDLSEKNLESSDLVNIYYPGGSFRRTNLKNCIVIDSVLNNTDFSDADLSGTDFSRAEMKSCQFINANLKGCDFENCDLSGSNFLGAQTDGARFPGAILNSVIF
jgi:uncharacterized protein YjbI with pentapeptide repeats